MKLGIIGYGNIGRIVAGAIADEQAGNTTLTAVLDVYEQSPFPAGGGAPGYHRDLQTFLEADVDSVVETASQAVLKQVAIPVLRHGFNLIAMSIGALVDQPFYHILQATASAQNRQVYIPSGAIGGLDVLAAAVVAGLDSVVLTTTKPAKSLAAVGLSIDPATLTEATCIYEGPAAEAVQHFPQNVNVAAALSLVGIGFEQTTVRIVADPGATMNRHQVEARGRFGQMTLDLELLPSPDNPKSSYLAALSVVALLRRLSAPIRIGT
jgi:aspartate dehydrogenase